MALKSFKPSKMLLELAKAKDGCNCFIPKNQYEHLIDSYREHIVEKELQKMRDNNESPLLILNYELDSEIYINKQIALYEVMQESLGIQIASCMKYIREKITDNRDKNRITYPLDSLIIVIMLACLYGYDDAKSIVQFYKDNVIELLLLVPGLPPLPTIPSTSTIDTVFQLIDKDDLEIFFTKYFSAIKCDVEKLVTYDDVKYKHHLEKLLDTLAFDGHECGASWLRDVANRRIKGGIIVTLFNCTTRLAQAYTTTDKKNHEVMVFAHLVANTSIENTVVMCDALNTAKEVTDCITANNAYYIMPVKNCRGNKEFRSHEEAIFNRQHANTLKYEEVNKDHGRIETTLIEILPAEPYVDKRIKNVHSNVNTLVKYTKKVEKYINGTVVKSSTNVRYYISSLPYMEKFTLRQVVASIKDYWFIEQHHNVLDSPLINQDQLQASNINTISNHAGFNKIRHSILTCIRQELTQKNGGKIPISFKEAQQYINKLPVICVFEYLFKYLDDIA